MKRKNPGALNDQGGAHLDRSKERPSYDLEEGLHECFEEDYYGHEAVDVICPSCGTEQAHAESYQGNLGVIEHHRCRYCGWQFSYRPTGENQ